MARPRAILQSEFPYNITARCINKEWFNIPMDIVWAIFCEELTRTIREKDLLVHCFVLMSNHFHLIASTPLANVSECTHQFMTRTSRRLTKEGNRINETFAGRHHKCVLDTYGYYLNAYKYNYRNPVTSGLSSRVEDYKYSTIRGILFPSEKLIPICDDPLFGEDRKTTLLWLNTAPDPAKLEGVRFGLKHQYFGSKKNRQNGRLLISEQEVL